MSEILNAIRHAIETSGRSRYRISQDLDMTQSQLSRLMSGERGLSIEALERLAAYLELEIIIRPRKGAKNSKR